MAHEGDFVNDPDDPGGATNKGITIATHRRYSESLLGKEATIENLKSISDSEACKIYKEKYWDSINGDQIADSELAYQITDFKINAGANAITILQETLNQSESNDLTVDGVFGPKTLAALNEANSPELYRRFRQGRIDYYERLARSNPDRFSKFLNGWKNRANDFDYY